MFAIFQQNYRIPGTNYKIIRFISKGTGGHVYIAQDISQNIYFALKIQESLKDSEYNALKHLNINGPFEHVVNILSLQHPNQFFKYQLIGMDLADGSFGQFWEENAQKFDIKQTLEFFLQITEGLEEIHKIGLIHRDMKLENVVYCNQNDQMILKICDTGLMRDNNQDLRKTFRIGTPYYMPPEQINQEIYNEKVDIWSLGVILFEMITKTKMIDDFDTNTLLNRITLLTQSQINIIISSQKQKIPIKIQELLKEMIVVNSAQRKSAQEVITKVKSILFQDKKIQQVQYKPINMQQFEQEKRNREKKLQEEKEKELKKLEEESQMKKQQQIIDLQNSLEAEKEKQLLEQKQQIKSNREQQIMKLKKEHQEKCDLIEQNSPNQQQYEISIKNMKDEYELKFQQIDIQYSEQLKQLEIQIQNDTSQQFEKEKEQIQQQIVQKIQNQVSQQFQYKFEQENIQIHQIIKYKENHIEEFTKSQALTQMELTKFTNQQFQQQISQNQEKIKFVQNFVEQLKQFLQQIQLTLNQLQKIQTKDDMEQFEQSKNEFVNIQHQNLKIFIEFQENSFQDIDNRQQIIIQEQMKQRLQSIAQECNELTINIDNQIQDIIKQLKQYNLSDKYKQTLSNYQNQNTQYKQQIKQLNESQFQFTSELQMNLLRQNLQDLQNDLDIFIKTIIKEIQDQLQEGIQSLSQKINYFYQLIKQTTNQENFRILFDLYKKNLTQQQFQDNVRVESLIENLILITEFFNLSNYAIEQIEIFNKFQQFSQNKLNISLNNIIDEFTINILNQVIKYMQNFTKKQSNKQSISEFHGIINTQFQNFFEKLISTILQQFDNQKINEQLLFQQNYEEFKSDIQNLEEEISKAEQTIQEDIKKWDQEINKFEQVQDKDQINKLILEQFQIAKQNQSKRYNQLQIYVNSTQQSKSLKSLNQEYQSSARNLQYSNQLLLKLKNQILSLQKEFRNIILQNLQPQYLEKVCQWFNDLNQLQEIDVLDAERQQLDKIFGMQCVHTFSYELFLLKSNLERFRQYYQKSNQQQLTKSNNDQKVSSLNYFINNIEKIQQQIIGNQFILQQNQINEYFRELLQEKCSLIQAGVINSFQQQKEDLDDDKITLQTLIKTTQNIKNILGEKIKQINLVKLRGKISSAQLQQLQLGNDLLERFSMYHILLRDHEF